MEPTQKLCSSEVSDITCQKSSFECRETIRDTLGTQILVESVLQNRPKSPPPVEKFSDLTNKPTSICSDCTECKKIIKSDETRVQQTCAMSSESRISSNVLKDQKPQIDNVVPKDWESPMLSALKTVPDPPKRALGPLASALAVAPAEPFTPAPPISFEPVPLPEETEPYFPPEHPVVLVEEEPKKSREPKELPCDIPFAKTPERARTPANPPPKPPKKKKLPEDELLKELPKPQSRLTMREALTIAPERSYTPLSFSSCGSELEKELDNLSEAAGEPVKDKPKENVRPVINENVIKPFKPAFQPMKDNKIEIIPEPEELKIEKSLESPSCELKPNDTIQEDTKIVSSQTTTEIRSESVNSQDSFIKTAVAKQAEDTILRKPMPVHSLLHRPDNLPQYQVNLSENVEMEILMMEKQELVQKYAAKKQSELGNAKVVDNKPPEITNKGPVVIIQGQGPVDPNTSFQPVNDGTASRGPTSPCPRPLTPSMVNKPAPVIPYYQANLVAQQHLAPDVNVFDPKSTTSRSPSPSVEGRRSTTPFRSTPVERAKSPAPGPPPNPLKTNEPLPTPQDTLKEEAKKTVSSYIPQHLGKTEMCAAVSHKDFSGNYQEQFDSKQIVEKDKMIQEQSLNVMKQEEAASNKQKIVVEATDGNVATTKFSEESSSKHLKKLDKTQTKSVETSSDGMCRIERKKLVTEEFEQTQKETVTQVEKNVTTTKAIPNYPFRNVNNPVIEQQGIIGLHVTNPQPISSPFFCKDSLQHQKSPSPTPISHPKQESVPPVAPPPCQIQGPPPIPKPIVPQAKVVLPPFAAKTANAVPVSDESASRPNVPIPNAGIGGGRQAGAVGVAPKRGRGILNAAALAGSRVPLCGHCHSYIRGPFITALGKIWCPEHFICATPSCRRPLQDLGFVEERGQLYCEYCFEQYLAPACSKCSAKVKGDCLKAIGKNFHPECFNCSYCGKLFGNSPFFLEDGLPYCEADWNELFTTKCFACGFPVEAGDRWVEALNNNYHSQCFNCTMCKKNLEGQSFFAKGGRPFCKNHAR